MLALALYSCALKRERGNLKTMQSLWKGWLMVLNSKGAPPRGVAAPTIGVIVMDESQGSYALGV